MELSPPPLGNNSGQCLVRKQLEVRGKDRINTVSKLQAQDDGTWGIGERREMGKG